MIRLLTIILEIGKSLFGWFFSPKEKFERAKNEDNKILTEHDAKAMDKKLDDLTDRP